jgi:hypothetical protein
LGGRSRRRIGHSGGAVTNGEPVKPFLPGGGVADNGEGMTRDEAIAEITRRLVDYCRPERVYLFGSVARGDDGADSDLDFCAVLPDNAPESLYRPGRGSLPDRDRETRFLARNCCYRRGIYRTWPSHSPSMLHSVRRRRSSTAARTETRGLISKTPGIGSPLMMRR